MKQLPFIVITDNAGDVLSALKKWMEWANSIRKTADNVPLTTDDRSEIARRQPEFRELTESLINAH